MSKTKWPVKKIDRNSEDLSKEFPDYEVAEHLQFNQTDFKTNANKFFSLELHKSSNGKWRVYTHYGRVKNNEYDHGAFEIRGPGTQSEMQDVVQGLIKDKTVRKDPYVPVPFVKSKVGSPKARLIVRQVEAGAAPKAKAPVIKDDIKIDKEVARIIDQIYIDSSTTLKSFVNVTISKDGFETPLGVLSPVQIEAGRKVLIDLQQAVTKQTKSKIIELSSKYYSLIPHQFGQKIREEDLISKDSDIQRESDILQLMSDSLQLGGAAYTDTTVGQYRELGITMAPISSNTTEYQKVCDYIAKTISKHHNDLKGIRVRNVFSLLLPHDRKRFENCGISNQQQLFHGSRNCNIVGILKRGLLIAPPEAPVSGYAFGKGLYFADQASKSINYSLKPFGAQRSSTDNCFLFLSDVRLGKMYEIEDGDSRVDQPKHRNNCDSVKGVVGRRLLHNEYIVYDLSQQTLTHLVELERPKYY